MLTEFFDQEGVHHNYIPPGQTNNEHYLNVLHQWRDAIQRKRLQLWATGDWQLLHHSVPVCASHLVRFFGETCDSAPDSPDLVPCDIWLFPELKSPLKGKRFQTINEIQENTTGQLSHPGDLMFRQKTLHET